MEQKFKDHKEEKNAGLKAKAKELSGSKDEIKVIQALEIYESLLIGASNKMDEANCWVRKSECLMALNRSGEAVIAVNKAEELMDKSLPTAFPYEQQVVIYHSKAICLSVNELPKSIEYLNKALGALEHLPSDDSFTLNNKLMIEEAKEKILSHIEKQWKSQSFITQLGMRRRYIGGSPETRPTQDPHSSIGSSSKNLEKSLRVADFSKGSKIL